MQKWLKVLFFSITGLKIISEDPYACNGTGSADESKRTKRVQEWSRQNWLGVILIIVSLYVQPE